jgi:hypothetical protein
VPCHTALAQDFSLDNLSFDGAAFDGPGEDLFAGNDENRPAWLQPFTFRLSQQLLAQINSHTSDLPGGLALPRSAATENSRLSLIVGVSAQTVLLQSEVLKAGERLTGDEVSGNALLRYANSMRNGDLLLAVTLQSALDAGSVLGSVALTHTLSNHLTLLTQVIATRADEDAAFATLDEDVRAGLTLTWAF